MKKSAVTALVAVLLLSLACSSSSSDGSNGGTGTGTSAATCTDACSKLGSLCGQALVTPDCATQCESATTAAQRNCIVASSTCAAANACPKDSTGGSSSSGGSSSGGSSSGGAATCKGSDVVCSANEECCVKCVCNTGTSANYINYKSCLKSSPADKTGSCSSCAYWCRNYGGAKETLKCDGC